MNLLSVDWDYFFPNPINFRPPGDDWPLYDWGAQESEFYIRCLWEDRALGFLRNGKELPMAQGWEQFWDRFRIRRGATLYYAESHSAIALPELCRRFKRGTVWNFDAHHDSGYHDETPLEVLEKLRKGYVTCEDWVWWYIAQGSEVCHILPPWKDPKAEHPPSIPIPQWRDNLEPVQEWFSAVFVCRSGAWMPSWTDGQFQEFLNSFPGGNVEELQPLVERSFDLGTVQTMLKSLGRLAESRKTG